MDNSVPILVITRVPPVDLTCRPITDICSQRPAETAEPETPAPAEEAPETEEIKEKVCCFMWHR